VLRFLLAGAVLVFCGYLLSYGLPLNKSIWSPSFTLMTTGLASLLQGILMYTIDIKNHRNWTTPFLVFGVNPLFLYVLSEVMAIVCWNIGLYSMLNNGIHAIVTNNQWASLCFALVIVTVCGLIGWWLYKRKIYIKI
jgi:predicted acyltransferase